LASGHRVAGHSGERKASPPVEIALYIAVAATPLALAPGLLIGYDVTPKLAMVYLAAAILPLCAGQWWPGVALLWRAPAGRLFYILLLVQAAWLMVSAAFSHDLALAVGGTTLRRLGALTQIVILCVVAVLAAEVSIDRRFTRRLFIAIEICAAIAGTYGIFQYLGWDPLLPAQLYTVRFTGDVVRPPATLRHAIYFANFLVPVILIAASLAMNEGRAGRRWFHVAVLSVSSAALVLTGTRSAVLGLMVGAIVLAVIEARRIGKKRMLTYIAACALAGAALLGALAVSRAGKSFRIRLGQWVQDSKGGTRLMVWRDSWPLIRDHWLTGIGPEVFAGAFRRLQSLQLSQAYPDHYHEDPHNLLIGAAVSLGVAGPVLLCCLIALGLVCAYRSVRKGAPEGALLAASLVAMTISEQFAPLSIANSVYFYLMIGLAVALASPAASGPNRVALRPIAKALLGVAAAAVAVTAALYVVPDAMFLAAERRLAQGDIEGARASFRCAVRFPFPSDSLQFSRQMASTARSLRSPWRQAALAAAKEASAEAERSGEQTFSALYQSAALAVVTGDLGSAEAKLRAAVDAAPWWYRAHEMLAQVLWLTGRGPEAEREAALALECAGRRVSEVRRTLDGARAGSAGKAQ
jgi:O-antigen ligase